MKAIVALTISLVFLSLLLFSLSIRQTEPPDEPAGRNPEAPDATIQRSDMDLISTRERVNPPPTTSDQGLDESEDIPEEDTSEVKFVSLDFEAQVFNDAGPVPGSWVFARKRLFDAEGRPVPNSMDFRTDADVTDGEGIITSTTSYPEGTNEDRRFEVFAYEPRFGLGFREFTLRELSEFGIEDLSIELERGETVIGRVVDEDGSPVARARVKLYMESRAEVNLSGLCILTAVDGTFSLSGVTLENRPVLVHVTSVRSADNTTWLEPRRGRTWRKSHPGRIVSNQKGVLKQRFDEDTRTWDVGDIVLSLSEQAGAIGRMLITEAPEAEAEAEEEEEQR